MTPRQRLNRFLEAVAVPNLALYLVIGQVLVFGLMIARPTMALAIPLAPELVLRGEWWRIFSFVFLPYSDSALWNFFSWMVLYFIGTSLETHWGAARFTLYWFIGWILTVAVAFLVPGAYASNVFFLHSVFFAFAFLAPDFEMMVFFVLPVKVKWLGLALWLMYGLQFIAGSMGVRLSILASVANFLIFFWSDIMLRLRGQGRRIVHAQRMRSAESDAPLHKCVVCGKDSNTHRDLDFRYCSKCAGQQCYCPDHIRNHEHVLVDNDVSPGSK
jgi:membrane associated rhomboid family serine protease